MTRIAKVINATEGPTVLDLGAVQHDLENTERDDWLHGQLCDEFERVVGVDYLPEPVAELNKDGYEFIQADVTEMELDIEADTVVAGELIEHVDNPGLMLARANAHLKTGGRLVLTTPNPWGLPILRRLLTGALDINDEHVAWYGPTVLRQLLDRHGFVVEEVETTKRNHHGLAHLAQWFNSDLLGGTTWVLTATKIHGTN